MAPSEHTSTHNNQSLLCVVETLGGRCLELDVTPETTLLEIKEKVAKNWQIQSVNQILAVDTDVLSDYDSLQLVCRQHLPIDGKLRLSLLSTEAPFPASRQTVLAEICERLCSGDPATRQAASRILAHTLLPEHHERELDYVVSRFRAALLDRRGHIRRAALASIACCMPRGHHAAAELLTATLEDSDESVRLAAVQALSCFMRNESGRIDFELDHPFIISLRRRMKHRRAEVRAVAAIAFGEVAPKAEVFQDELATMFDDKEECVQMAVWEAYRTLKAEE